jgi:hypothetical protein
MVWQKANEVNCRLATILGTGPQRAARPQVRPKIPRIPEFSSEHLKALAAHPD